MKQFIVLAAMVALGIYIYNVIAGPEPGSIMSSLSGLWLKGVEIRSYTP